MFDLSQCGERLVDTVSARRWRTKTGRCSGPTAQCLWTGLGTWSDTRCPSQTVHTYTSHCRQQEAPLKLNSVFFVLQRRKTKSCNSFYGSARLNGSSVHQANEPNSPLWTLVQPEHNHRHERPQSSLAVNVFVFTENQPFPRDEWNLPQRLAGEKLEPDAETFPQRLQYLSQNVVPSCRVSLLLLSHFYLSECWLSTNFY